MTTTRVGWNRRPLTACLLTAGTLILGSHGSHAQTASTRSWSEALNARITEPYSAPQFRQFDFWIGEWEVNWRSRLKGELYHQDQGSWTRGRVFPIFGGKALVEIAWDRDKADQASQRGLSIRYLDTEKQRWIMAQFWPSASGTGSGMLDQLIGQERHGRLTMYSIQSRPGPDGVSRDEHRRYNFADVRPGVSLRWDGSNTKDKGATWTTWAISEMHRLRDLDPYGVAGTSFPDVRSELLCPEPPHGALDHLQGVWEGNVAEAGGSSQAARLSAGILLDGCAVGAVLEAGETRTFMTFAYTDTFGVWVNFRLDDRPETTHTYYLAKELGEGKAFEEAREVVIEDEFTHFVTRDKLDSVEGLRRTVWETSTPDALVWRDEVRDDRASDWRLHRRFALRKIR